MLNKSLGVICGCLALGVLPWLGLPLSIQASPVISPVPKTVDLELKSAQVRYHLDLDLLVFEQKVSGLVGGTKPQPAGQLDGAPVLGYVFPTSLDPQQVGFGEMEGILALAVTLHPDFDDTPLWDEDNDRVYDNDGGIFHTHWVVLGSDQRVPGQLSVQAVEADQLDSTLPPTHPGMPMALDSPGFSVVIQQETLKILVPAQRVNHQIDFNFDGVSAYMQVNTSDPNRPLLGVYEVYSVLSGDLSLPYGVEPVAGECSQYREDNHRKVIMQGL